MFAVFLIVMMIMMMMMVVAVCMCLCVAPLLPTTAQQGKAHNGH